jgi:Sulfotransferase family
MIVSHRHRFIFLKSKKTAGTSVELALSAVCDPGDIITPLAQPEDEPLRRGLSPQNWRRRTLAANAQRKLAEVLDHCTKRIDYYEHIKASRARKYLGERVWKSYFKFTVERNPWDRQVSYWQFKTRKLGCFGMTFAAFLETEYANLSSADIYMIDDKLAIDHVVRYEHLASDLKAVLDHLGIETTLDLPRAKGNYRQVGDYRVQYDDATREWVAQTYGKEIDLFGYRFEDPEPRHLDGRIRMAAPLAFEDRLSCS